MPWDVAYRDIYVRFGNMPKEKPRKCAFKREL
jgi:hypothetical protein